MTSMALGARLLGDLQEVSEHLSKPLGSQLTAFAGQHECNAQSQLFSVGCVEAGFGGGVNHR
jgi:hypothetical protein